MTYAVFALAGCCAHCRPISLEALWRPQSTPNRVLAPEASSYPLPPLHPSLPPAAVAAPFPQYPFAAAGHGAAGPPTSTPPLPPPPPSPRRPPATTSTRCCGRRRAAPRTRRPPYRLRRRQRLAPGPCRQRGSEFLRCTRRAHEASAAPSPAALRGDALLELES